MSRTVSRHGTNQIPEPVAPIARLMSTFPAPWALCGGWAVDAWLGRQTRDHDDVDLSVFIDDQRALFDHLGGWQLVAHDSAEFHAPWDGRRLEFPNHVMARRDTGEPLADRVDSTPEDGFILDVQLGDRFGDDWVLSRQPDIRLPIRDAVQLSPWGLSTVMPEVLLFFKATEFRRRDKLDFLALLPILTRHQRDWLHNAISLIGHPWLPDLSP